VQDRLRRQDGRIRVEKIYETNLTQRRRGAKTQREHKYDLISEYGSKYT
jgi:hypothetical protein